MLLVQMKTEQAEQLNPRLLQSDKNCGGGGGGDCGGACGGGGGGDCGGDCGGGSEMIMGDSSR